MHSFQQQPTGGSLRGGLTVGISTDASTISGLSDSAQVAIQKHKAELRKIETIKLARTIAVPVDDHEVRLRLRVLREPMTVFGEHLADRRERLRNLLALLALDNQLDAFNKPFEERAKRLAARSGPTALAIADDKPYLIAGTDELRAARLRLTAYSLAAAEQRLAKEHELCTRLDLRPVSKSSGNATYAALLAGSSASRVSLPPASTPTIREARKAFRTQYRTSLQRASLSRVISSQCATVSVGSSSTISMKTSSTSSLSALSNISALSGDFGLEDGLGEREGETGNDTSLGLGSSRPVGGLCAMPNYSHLALAGSWGGAVSLLNLDTGKPVHSFTGMTDRVTGVAVNPRGSFTSSLTSSTSTYTPCIAACGPEGLVLWGGTNLDVENARPLHNAQKGLGTTSQTLSSSHVEDDFDMFSDDIVPTHLPSSSNPSSSSSLITNSSILTRLHGHTDRLSRVVWHPSGEHILSSSYDGTWRLWDVETGTCLANPPGHSSPVYALAIHPDGSLVTTGDLGGVARLWDLRTGRALIAMEGHSRQVISASFSPNGFRVATGSGDNTVKLWDLRQRKCEYTIPAHTNLISDVQFEPVRGDSLLTASYDGTMGVFSAYDFSRAATLVGSDQKVMRACFSSDGNNILSGCYDGMVKVWGVDEDEFNIVLEEQLRKDIDEEMKHEAIRDVLKLEHGVDFESQQLKQEDTMPPSMED